MDSHEVKENNVNHDVEDCTCKLCKHLMKKLDKKKKEKEKVQSSKFIEEDGKVLSCSTKKVSSRRNHKKCVTSTVKEMAE